VFSCSSDDVAEMMTAAAFASDWNLIMDGWFINTLRTGDANLHFCITTVKDK
jgi:hypothetical protein